MAADGCQKMLVTAESAALMSQMKLRAVMSHQHAASELCTLQQ